MQYACMYIEMYEIHAVLSQSAFSTYVHTYVGAHTSTHMYVHKYVCQILVPNDSLNFPLNVVRTYVYQYICM